MANGAYTFPGMSPTQPQGQRPGALVSLIRGIQGFREMPARREAMAGYLSQMSQLLRRHGTESANQYADLLEQNPLGFLITMQQMYGSVGALDKMLAQQAQQQQQQSILSMMPVETPEQALALALGGTKEGVELAGKWGELGPEEYEPQTQIEKLQEALRQARARGDEKAAKEIENALVKAQFGSQTEVSWGPEGGSVRIGPKIPGQEEDLTTPTKATQTRLQTAITDYTNQMARTKGALSTFEKRFYESGYRLWAGWEEFKTKHLKGELTSDEETELNRFWKHQRRTWEDHNLTMKEISGAAVNPQESARVRRQMIDPGEHWWEGDSPPKAKAKLRDGLVITARAKAIAIYALKHPGAISAAKNELGYKYNIGLDEIYKLISEYAYDEWDRIAAQYPGMTKEGIRNLVNSSVVQEFGVTWDDVVEPD